MKVLTVSDIHLKPELIERAAKTVRRQKPERIVFMGDYFDDWGAVLTDYAKTIAALKRFRDEFGTKTVFLWGNHEYSYIAERPCSGYEPRATFMVNDFLKKFPLQMAFQVDGYLWTHAGVTSGWYRRWIMRMGEGGRPKPNNYIAADMNATFTSPENPGDCMWFSAGPARGGSDTPSPLWADQDELVADPLPYPILKGQVVGHTPVRMIHEIGQTNGGRLIFTDTFSNANECDTLLLFDTKNGKSEFVDA